MSPDDHDELDNDAAGAPDEWKEFRDDDGEPSDIEELKDLNLKEMPEDVVVRVMDKYFPRQLSVVRVNSLSARSKSIYTQNFLSFETVCLPRALFKEGSGVRKRSDT